MPLEDEDRRAGVDCCDTDEVDALLGHHFPHLNAKRRTRDVDYFDFLWKTVYDAEDRTQPFSYSLAELPRRAMEHHVAWAANLDSIDVKHGRRPRTHPQTQRSWWFSAGEGPERSLERLRSIGAITYTLDGDDVRVTLAPGGVACEQRIPGWFEDDGEAS